MKKRKFLILLLALTMGVATVALGACDNEEKGDSYIESGSLTETSSSEEVGGDDVEESSEDESASEEVKTPTEGLVYARINEKAEYAVVDIGEATDAHIVIPDTYEGLPVTAIGKSAFAGNCDVRGVTISDSVVTIEEAAFKDCAFITYVYMGRGVKYIGKEAFAFIDDRAEIHFHDSMEVIKEDAFGTNTSYASKGDWFFYGDINKYAMIDFATYESSPNLNHYMHVNGEMLEEITLDTATYISSYAFANQDSIVKYNIGKSVKKIGKDAISAAIFHMNFDGSLSLLPYDVYYEGTLQDFLDIEFVEYWAAGTGVNLYLNNELVENVVFPADIQVIPEGIFSCCTSLKSVQIPQGITAIGQYAFWGCEKMTEISIPDSVTDIGDYALFGCYGLTKLPTMNGVTSIGECAFEQCENIVEGDMPENLVSIEEYAFANCGIRNAILPESVTFIGEGAFSSSGVKKVSIPDGVMYVGKDVFLNCESVELVEYDNCTYVGNENSPYLVLLYANDNALQECIIHEDAKIIVEDAFEFCQDLKKLTIGSNLKIIARRAFSNYLKSNLLEVYYQGTIENWCAISDLYVLTEKVQTAIVLYINNERISSVVIPEGVTEIKPYTFYNFGGSEGITEVIIPNSVTTIGDFAFAYCDNIVQLTIGKGVKHIKEGAFIYAINLNSITFNGTVEEWDAIEKESEWDKGTTIEEIVCVDGTITL